jgi:hypothetical protein
MQEKGVYQDDADSCVARSEWLTCDVLSQIGFLTEWQLYAQQVEGDAWLGEKLDQGKVAKMSGMLGPFLIPPSWVLFYFSLHRIR